MIYTESEDMLFIVNDYITLVLENGQTNIYVKNSYFNQCKFLSINITIDDFENFKEISSIDEMIDRYDNSLEGYDYSPIWLSPEDEFWAHCSNLQVWVENNYDTRFLHYNLAFPLLKKLTDEGELKALRVLKEEISKRLLSGYPSVMQFLINEGYLEYFNAEEVETLIFMLEELLIPERIHKYRNSLLNIFKRKKYPLGDPTRDYLDPSRNFKRQIIDVRKYEKIETIDGLKSRALKLDDRKLIWFINNVRENLYYTLNHSWYNPDSDKIGLTPFYGDIEGIYSVNVENLKDRLFKLYYCEEYNEYLGTSIDDVLKTYSKMYTWSHFVHPVTGKVIDVNAKLKTNPFIIFRDPFGEGWICRIKPDNLERDLKNLYTPLEYILINYDRYFRKIYAKVSKKKYRW